MTSESALPSIDQAYTKALQQQLEPLFNQFNSEIKDGRVRDVQGKYFPQVNRVLEESGIMRVVLGQSVAPEPPHAQFLSLNALQGSDLLSDASRAIANLEDLLSDASQAIANLERPPITDLPINGINPFHNTLVKPTNVGEVQLIVKNALRDGKKVRVIGAAHSRPKELIMDVSDPSKVVLVSLTEYRGVHIDKEKGLAYVKAGTNLGHDPSNPESSLPNSVCVQLDKEGYMLPITGGTTHQTCGGFASTGSEGGSLLHGFHDALYAVSLVDGKGDTHRYSCEDSDPSTFYAAVVSAGLCGIITDIEIKLFPKQDVKGQQKAYTLVQPGDCPVDLFGETGGAKPEITAYLSNPENEYCRMLWFPHSYLPPRLQIWSAKKVTPQAQHDELPPLSKALQEIARSFLELIWCLGQIPLLKGLSDWLSKKLIDLMVPLDTMQNFLDTWYKLLPQDDGIIDIVMPVVFAELWVSTEDATKALRTIRQLNVNDPKSVGNLFTELYSAKSSPFWLSPSNTGGKVRIGLNWFQYNLVKGKWGDPAPFFQKYFDALDKAGIHYTTHLGKYRPPNHCTVEHLRRDYPNYDKWLKIREGCDPGQVFLTNYWAHQLQIEKK